MQPKLDDVCQLPVFVYGTLKREHCNHRILTEAKFLDTGSINGFIFSTGAYPAFVNAGEKVVQGELFEITRRQLSRLDHFEGKDFLYDRVIVDVTKPNGEVVKAWVYEYINVPTDTQLVPKKIESGIWTKEAEQLY